MSTTIDKLIEKFKEVKEDLNKNMNASYATAPNATTGTSGGQGGMYRSERYEAEKIEPKDKVDKNVVAPMAMQMAEAEAKKSAMAQDAMMMAEAQKKEATAKAEWQKSVATEDHEFLKFDTNGQWHLKKSYDGANRQANPKLKMSDMGTGKHRMVKQEGTNEEANPTQPHNKAHFDVMPMITEKESKKEKVAGLPYNGEDKKVHKDEECAKCKHAPCKCGNDENKAPGRVVQSV